LPGPGHAATLRPMDEPIHQPHDKLFKASFSDPANAAAFLKSRVSPELAAGIEWESLRLEPGSFIDSRFRHSESDLLFSAPFGQTGQPKTSRCHFHFLLEHLSSPVPLIALRLLCYKTRIWEECLARAKASGEPCRGLPVVMAVVVAQNDGRWEISPRFADLFDIPEGFEEIVRPFIPDFSFSLLQLGEIPYDAIAGTPAGILTLRVLKADRSGELLGDEVWDEALMMEVARECFERVLRYLMRGGIDTQAFEARVEKIIEPQLRSTTMTLAEQYIEKGIVKGREEGREESRKADILEALEIRFGTVPEGVRDAVESAGGQQRLRELHRAAITSATLEEFAGAL